MDRIRSVKMLLSRFQFFGLFFFGLFLSGCAASTTNMTTPTALQPGEFEASASGHGRIDSRFVSSGVDLLDRAKNRIRQHNNQDPLTKEQTRKIFNDVLSVALFRPTITPELGGRIGITEAIGEGLDAGVRFNSNSVKGDLKFQLWEAKSGNRTRAISFQTGVGHQFGLNNDLIEQLTLTDFSRTDLDIMALYGSEGNYFRWYLGPRFIQSWVSTSPALSSDFRDALPQEYRNFSPSQFFHDETMQMFGGTAGVMVGLKGIYLTVELTVMRTAFEPTVIDRKKNMDGTFYAPAVGLVTEF